jgi:hypothetical protein
MKLHHAGVERSADAATDLTASLLADGLSPLAVAHGMVAVGLALAARTLGPLDLAEWLSRTAREILDAALATGRA